MATRVKKQPAATVTAAKEIVPVPQPTKNEVPATGTDTPITSHEVAVRKRGRKPGIKKTVAFKARTKVVRKRNLKINPKNLARVLMENGKGLTDKQILLKNGTKDVVKRIRKPKIKQNPSPEGAEQSTPVLEPIFPQEENLEVKKAIRKRGRKSQKIPALIAIKKEPEDDSVGSTSEPTVVKRKAGRPRKPKPEQSMEEVMTDLSFLIDPSRIKKEVVEAPKPKKLTKRQRLELIKKDLTKKENLENTLNKLDAADAKLIDRLDLNVRKFKTILPKVKRRHSIEKIPITGDTVFNQLPRSLSPKTSKRTARLLNKPYTTRSDSPARMLRNGKHRRLKDFVLLEGLEGPKRRKRVHSDLSGSETASKLSGYESDSSYSDMASLHDGNKDIDSLLLDESSNAPTQIDTNSNVCDSKMPEKNLLLDIMKQAFNDMSNDKLPVEKLPVEKPCTSTSTEEQELRQLLEQTEEKQAAEQIQECIDNITNLAKAASEEAPVLEKQIQDDSIPVIDNMSSEPPQNLEHLGPPLLESSVAMLEQKRSFVDENIGIAVVEKDNVVSFHIEHLSGDDVDEPETSNEDLNQSLDEKMEVETEEKVEEDVQTEEKVIETESKETEVEVEESVDEVEVKQQCNMKVSVAEPECAVEESVAEAECAVEEAKCEVEVEEPKNECTSVVEEPKNDEATKQPEEAKTIVEQDDKVDETGQEILTEKEDCDKTSENIDVKKPEETEAVKESPEQLAEKESVLGALGLQSLRAAKEAPQPRKKGKASTSKAAADSYTGTLKTVIKINKKRGKNSFKMTLQKNKNKSEKVEAAGGTGEDGYKVLKEVRTYKK
ncbi:unnamed protein product [Ceutorhynchus assimilis]|uniref:Uncharacterized protein n=1 Tax=Ceutorhynchus assimilis TaxID=467358 RepID=A0A9N9QFU9_9CUCU|nr:unnamed protein product [Ceutorhynchus assimilis]